MFDHKQVTAARNFQQALSESCFYLESMSGRKPKRIVKGHPVHTAWEQFRLTFPGGVLPRGLNRLCLRLQRLSIAGSEEAFEVAEELDGKLARYAGEEHFPAIDGPIEPRGFRWKGIEYDLEPRQDKLLKVMWGKKFRKAAEVIDEVWDNDYNGKTDPFKSLNATISKVNAVLFKAGVPWCLSKQGDYIVCKPEE